MGGSLICCPTLFYYWRIYMIRLKDIKINEDLTNQEVLKKACKKYKKC